MKSSSNFRLTALLLLTGALIGSQVVGGNSQPGLSGAPAHPETNQHPSEGGRLKWADVVEEQPNGSLKLICDKFFAEGSTHYCGNHKYHSSSNIKQKLGNFWVRVWRRGMTAESDTLLLIPQNNTKSKEKIVQSFESVREMRSSHFLKVISARAQEDFVEVILNDDYSLLWQALRSFLGSQESAKDDWGPGTSLILGEAVEALGEMHSRGWVGINPVFLTPAARNGTQNQLLGHLEWLTKMGREVGAHSFDPLLTDPVALADPTFKADIALDFYALGANLYAALEFDENEVAEKKRLKKLADLKEKGEFVFSQGTDSSLAFMAAWFLQDNRGARVNKGPLKEVQAYLEDPTQVFKLKDSVTYRASVNPLEVPEFQEFLQQTPLLNTLPKTAPAKDTASAQKSEILGLPHWAWVTGAAVLALVLVLGTVLWCRSKNSAEGAGGADAKKELRADDTQQPAEEP